MTREPTAGTASGKSARRAQLPEAPGGHGMTRELTDATDSAAAAERGLVEDARRRILDLIGNQTLRPGDRVGTERERSSGGR